MLKWVIVKAREDDEDAPLSRLDYLPTSTLYELNTARGVNALLFDTPEGAEEFVWSTDEPQGFFSECKIRNQQIYVPKHHERTY